MYAFPLDFLDSSYPISVTGFPITSLTRSIPAQLIYQKLGEYRGASTSGKTFLGDNSVQLVLYILSQQLVSS
jgi:hypothetical protein